MCVLFSSFYEYLVDSKGYNKVSNVLLCQYDKILLFKLGILVNIEQLHSDLSVILN